jgi:hypothetical protein
MNDRERYTEIAKILPGESPHPEQENHLHICIWPKQAVDRAIWFGQFKPQGSSYVLSTSSTAKMSDLLQSLYDYFQENDLGKWNLAHYILAPNGESFSFDFE